MIIDYLQDPSIGTSFELIASHGCQAIAGFPGIGFGIGTVAEDCKLLI